MDGVIVGRVVKPRRCVIYGKKGIGKSTWAAGAPSPIFIQCEEGLEDIGAPRFPRSDSFQGVIDLLQRLAQEEHKFRTVAVDSLDGLQDLIFAQVCKDKGVDNIEDCGYGKGYTFALDYWRKILACLDYLRDEKSMGVVLIAHDQLVKFEDPELANYDQWTLQLNKHATAEVTKWADEVLFATYKTFVRTSKEGFGREKARGIGSGEREIKTTHRPSYVAKNRLGMPDAIEFPKQGGFDMYLQYAEKHHATEAQAKPADVKGKRAAS